MPRTRLFVSYSHVDKRWLKRLQVHLAPLERAGLVDLWDDTRIKPGMKWRDEIRAAIAEARVAVLLVTADFLASEFIAKNELPPLLKAAEGDGALILPVIVGPSAFSQTPILSEFQSVNPPSKPLSKQPKAHSEEVFQRLAEVIRKAATTDTPSSPTPKSVSGDLSSAGASAQRTSSRKHLLSDLATCSARELMDRILANRFTLNELNQAVRDDRAAASQLLRAIARRLDTDSDTWLRMLAAQVASHIEDPCAEACAVAFDGSYHWGARTTAITWLRFSPAGSRDADAERVYKHLSGGDVDAARLVVSAMGFVANTIRISDVVNEYDAFEDSYGNEKLAPYVVKAYLNCFVHHGTGWLPTDVLRLMSEIYQSAERRNHMHLSEFNFFTLLQVLSPGPAVNLLEHLVNNRNARILMAVLWVLKDRSNRHALTPLLTLVGDSETSDHLRSAAVNAIGRIRSDEALETSLELAPRYPALKSNGAILSVGSNRSYAHVGLVRDAISSRSVALATACWALGELASNGDPELIKLLRLQTEQSVDSVARSIAWLGLAKASTAPSETELEEAADSATDYSELVILGIAAAQCGRIGVLRKALHSSQINHAPIWRLEGHLCHDYRAALHAGLGEPGRILLELWKRGDVD